MRSFPASRLPIGFCGLRFLGAGQDLELLYGFSPAWWGRGLATEAARAVLTYAFEVFSYPRVLAGADPSPRASFRVMERVGMKPATGGHGMVSEGYLLRDLTGGVRFLPSPFQRASVASVSR